MLIASLEFAVTPLRPGPPSTLIGRLSQVTTAASPAQLERELEGYRRELTGYCYRMLGSAFDAADAAQGPLPRAWGGVAPFWRRSCAPGAGSTASRAARR